MPAEGNKGRPTAARSSELSSTEVEEAQLSQGQFKTHRRVRSRKFKHQKAFPLQLVRIGLFSFMMVFAKVTPVQWRPPRPGTLTSPGPMVPGSLAGMRGAAGKRGVSGEGRHVVG